VKLSMFHAKELLPQGCCCSKVGQLSGRKGESLGGGSYVCAGWVLARAGLPRGFAPLRGVGERVRVVDLELDRRVAVGVLVDGGFGDLEGSHGVFGRGREAAAREEAEAGEEEGDGAHDGGRFGGWCRTRWLRIEAQVIIVEEINRYEIDVWMGQEPMPELMTRRERVLGYRYVRMSD